MDSEQESRASRPQHPGKVIRQRLQDKGWTQEDLAAITSRSRTSIGSILAGKSALTAETALALGAALGLDPGELLRMGAAYELWMSDADTRLVERGARLFDIAPVREMQRRGWIPQTDKLEELERHLSEFYATDITKGVEFPVATRRTTNLEDLNIAEKAWCFRARQLAGSVVTTGPFDPSRMDLVEKKLRRLAAFPKEAGKLSETMFANGIRFVVVEPLPGAKIDGAAFWLDEKNPVIAVSIRHDRIDAFWFTVMHEFAHIKHGDLLSADSSLIADNGMLARNSDEIERRANATASHALVPDDEMSSFIRRLRPYYSSDRVVQFANRVKMHPGIIVGQLHHRGEIGYAALRDFLVKIRAPVVTTALTDGWGQTISPHAL